jgi:hypothetical protein
MTASSIRAIIAALSLATLAACSGNAVVTLTGTVPQNTFLAYRVGLASIALKTADGKTTVQALPAEMTVDLSSLGQRSVVLGAAPATKGSYSSAVITLDYSAAQIVADDGSLNGTALTAVGANGQALGQIQITADLDPNNLLSISTNKSARLSLDFMMSASNSVNLTAKTVTVTPMISASAVAIDDKMVMVRGPLGGVDTTNVAFVSGIAPYDVAGTGKLQIAPTATTTYEVNGTASTGATGLSQLDALAQGSPVVAYGTFTTTDVSSTTADVAGESDIGFSATEVLGGSSVQGSGFDRVSGVVSARSGASVTLEDATLTANDGTISFIPGTTLVELGSNTAVTVAGQGDAAVGNTTQQISVGSTIAAFGLATVPGSGDATLDASAGRVRIDDTTAAGLVTVQGSASLTLSLNSLGGRSVAAFDFSGTGASTDAVAAAYSVDTGTSDLTYSTVGAPVAVSGMVAGFGAAPPDFTASTLLDSTTLSAELVVDWGAGTATPFVQFTSSEIDVNAHDSAIGSRHFIDVGPQQLDITQLSSDPLIVPGTSGETVFSIGHAATGSVDNFNSYADFITALQTDLNGVTVATGMTAEGQYAASSGTLTAAAITLYLND